MYYRLEIWQLDSIHKINPRRGIMDGQPPSLGWSPTNPRTVTHLPKSTRMDRLEIWHLHLIHKIETRLNAIDGQPPDQGWSPTIPRKVTHNPRSTWRNCTTELKFANKSKSGEVPWMVSHQSKGAHPLSKIYQKELCYQLKIWHLDFTQKKRPGEVGMISHHIQDGHPTFQGWLPTIQNLLEGECTAVLEFGT